MAQNVAPNRMVLGALKARRLGAKKGHGLLKKKADALKMKLRRMMGIIIENKEAMGGLMSDAFFSGTEARYVAGNFLYSSSLLLSVVTIQQLLLPLALSCAGQACC